MTLTAIGIAAVLMVAVLMALCDWPDSQHKRIEPQLGPDKRAKAREREARYRERHREAYNARQRELMRQRRQRN